MRTPSGVGKETPAQRVHRALNLPGELEQYDVIQFQYGSKNNPVGLGAGEQLSTREGRVVDRSGYATFLECNGRSILSNMFSSEIEVGGVLYPSVEHAFHAGKALLMNDLDGAMKFAKGGEYGELNAVHIKKFGGKRFLPMSKEAIRAWNGGESEKRMREAIEARVHSSDLFKRVLKATGNAVLVHQIRGVVDTRLSAILNDIREILL